MSHALKVEFFPYFLLHTCQPNMEMFGSPFCSGVLVLYAHDVYTFRLQVFLKLGRCVIIRTQDLQFFCTRLPFKQLKVSYESLHSSKYKSRCSASCRCSSLRSSIHLNCRRHHYTNSKQIFNQVNEPAHATLEEAKMLEAMNGDEVL